MRCAHPPTDRATALAEEARRIALVTAVRRHPGIPLDQLICLVSGSKYADDLAELQPHELSAEARPPPRVMTNQATEAAILRVFRLFEGQWFSSGFFMRYFDVERWTAQKICGELAERGELERRGRTGGTRYRFVRGSR